LLQPVARVIGADGDVHGHPPDAGAGAGRRHGPAARPAYRRAPRTQAARRRRAGSCGFRGHGTRDAYPRPVAGDEQPDELPKVTLAFLRRVEELCPRRVAFEYHHRRGNRVGPARGRGANQIPEHARPRPPELRPPTAEAFTPLPDLLPEEREVYGAAARWYLQLFGGRAVRSVDGTDVDEWETRLSDEGIRLVGRAGLAVEDENGRPELRLLRIGGPAPDGSDPLSSPDARFALLRAGDWLTGRSVRLRAPRPPLRGLVGPHAHTPSLRA